MTPATTCATFHPRLTVCAPTKSPTTSDTARWGVANPESKQVVSTYFRVNVGSIGEMPLHLIELTILGRIDKLRRTYHERRGHTNSITAEGEGRGETAAHLLTVDWWHLGRSGAVVAHATVSRAPPQA